ncbi:MAG: multicopper oxidase domain-containing protein, partial [Kangiellaceae bacterium]|nr:multicopper oxidase domain-containing protein [Kangiellaceae bacterium]
MFAVNLNNLSFLLLISAAVSSTVHADTKNYYDILKKTGKSQLKTEVPAKPGCEFQTINIKKYGLKPFKNPKVIQSDKGELNTTLTVKYAEHNIAGCDTHLRTYNGELVGPTLKLKPGDTLRVKLRNRMPPCDPKFPERCTHGNGEMNNPGNFNVTNLHTHGFHVSPAGNSDNVLLQIQPGTDFDYEIKVPPNHPSGTFWYHAHVHGSTALQVSSGMAGTLIVEGGLDDAPGIKEMEEKTFVFQQIAYDCRGVIESYVSQCADGIGGFGPGEWEKTKRHILING